MRHNQEQARLAERLAREAHAAQVDKANQPYTEHLQRVAAHAANDGELAVAWLHDIIEDTSWDALELAAAGIDEGIIDDVVHLSRKPEETYVRYIDRIRKSGSKRALAVKLADLSDHLDKRPNVINRGLRERYQRAFKDLRQEDDSPKR